MHSVSVSLHFRFFTPNDFHNINICWFIFLISSLASSLLSQWEPSKLELVSDSMVATYFSMMDNEDWEDLKLPARSNLPVYAIAKL
jgi:hypothetical protein